MGAHLMLCCPAVCALHPVGPVEWCNSIRETMLPLLPSLRVNCIYFNTTAFVAEHGFPPDLALEQTEAQDFDWGVEPQWAALVNVWTAQFLDKEVGRINCFADSNYGAIMRQVGQCTRGSAG